MAHTPDHEMVPHCAAQLMTNEDLFLPGVYEQRSELAHQVLGVGLLCIVLVWGAFIIEVPSGFNLKQAYLIAGILEALSGSFLLAWVFYLLEPSQPVALAKYAMKSLVQLQHVAISLSLVACGMTDVAISASLHGHRAKQTGSTRGREGADTREEARVHSIGSDDDIEDEDDNNKDDDVGDGDEAASVQLIRRCRSSRRNSHSRRGSEPRSVWGTACYALRYGGSWWAAWPSRVEAHTVWAMNLTFAGLVFLTHPQMSLEKDGEHVALGLSLIIGAHFLAIERRDGWKPDSMQALVAGAFFGVAVTILCIFREFRPPAAASSHSTMDDAVPIGDDQKDISSAGIGGSRRRMRSSVASSGKSRNSSSSGAQELNGGSVGNAHGSAFRFRTLSSLDHHGRRAQGHVADDDGFRNTKDDDDDWDVVDERGKPHVESRFGGHASADHPYKQSKSHAGPHVVVSHLGNSLPNHASKATTTHSESSPSPTAVAGSLLSAGSVPRSGHERSNFVCLEGFAEEHTASVHLCRKTDGSSGWVCPLGWEQIQKPPRCLPSKYKGNGAHRTSNLSASTEGDKARNNDANSGDGSGSRSKTSTSKNHGGEASEGGRSNGGRSTVHPSSPSRTHTSTHARASRALAVPGTYARGEVHSRALYDSRRRAQGRAISDDALANEFVDTVDDDDDDNSSMYTLNVEEDEEKRQDVNGPNSGLVPTPYDKDYDQNENVGSNTVIKKTSTNGEDKKKATTKKPPASEEPPFVCSSGYTEEVSVFAGRVCRKADGSKNWRCPIGWLQTKELPHCVWRPQATVDENVAVSMGSIDAKPDSFSSSTSSGSISSSSSGSIGISGVISGDSGGSGAGSGRSGSISNGIITPDDFAIDSSSGRGKNVGMHSANNQLNKAEKFSSPVGSYPTKEHSTTGSAALSMPAPMSSPTSPSSSSSVGVHHTVVAEACQSGLQLAAVAGILAILTIVAAAGAVVCGVRCRNRCKSCRRRFIGSDRSSTIESLKYDSANMQMEDEEWQAAAVQVGHRNNNSVLSASGASVALAAAASAVVGSGSKQSHLMHPGRYELASSE